MSIRVTIATLFLLILPQWLIASERVALVIGIGEYDNTENLANPSRDAKAVAKALSDAGFDVMLSIDADQSEFGQTLVKFLAKTKGAEASIFYFAGHGIQINSKNYLLSKTAKVKNPILIDQDGYELGKILDLMARNSETSIALIDACRDNPLAEALVAATEPSTRSAWGMSRGLARIEGEFSNSLVAFATSPGRVAFDGSAKHSPFTSALLEHISTPGIEISVLLKRVTRDVLKNTEGEQRPEIVASMAQEFYFYKPTVNVDGNVIISQPEDPEVAATALLRMAMELPDNRQRDTSLELLAKRFEGTTAAGIATNILNSRPPVEAPAATGKPDNQDSDSAILHGLDIDRLKQEELQSRLNANTATPQEAEAALGLSRDEIVRIQETLNSLGYHLGATDGSFGNRSRNALRRFQLANRVPETGYLDRNTIDKLLKVVAEAPKSYDGKWQLIIYREWLRDDPNYAPNKKGRREVLASVNLIARDGRFFIQNYHYRTIEPVEAFSDFDATYTSTGRVTVKGGVSSMFRDANHVVPSMERMFASLRLPEIMPHFRSVEASGNRFDNNLKFYVKLSRQK